MNTYSTAARTHATNTNLSLTPYARIAAAFDAGFAKHLDTPGPERVVVGNPRWRDGAKVRGEFADGTAIEGSLRQDGGLWFIYYGAIESDSWYINPDNGVPIVYLIAEAPDPDNDLLEAMMKADCFREDWDVYVSRLEFMRKAGIKVELA